MSHIEIKAKKEVFGKNVEKNSIFNSYRKDCHYFCHILLMKHKKVTIKTDVSLKNIESRNFKWRKVDMQKEGIIVKGWKTCILVIGILALYTIPIYASQGNANGVENQKSPSIQTISVQAQPGENITVPIMLKNNPGIMGLGLTVDYNEEYWKPKSVNRGELLTIGNLTDSIGTEESLGKVKILWSDTKELAGDGEILEVVFEPLGSETFTDVIQITCSTPDTFRESWDEVTFAASTCEVVVSVNEADYAQNVANEIASEAEQAGISQEQIKKEIQAAVSETGHSKLSEIQDEKTKTETAEKVTDKLNAAGLDIKDKHMSFEVVEYLNDEVSEEKKQERLDTSIQIRDKLDKTISKEKQKEILEQSLQKIGASGFDELSAEQRNALLEQLNKQFILEGFDLQKEMDGYSTEEKLEMLSMLYKDVSGEVSLESQQVNENMANRQDYWMICIRIIVYSVITVIIVIVIRRMLLRKRTNDSECIQNKN